MTDRAAEPWGRCLATGAVAVLASVSSASLVATWASIDTPLAAVATRVINAAPPSVKHWAISTFAKHDKLVLGIGIAILLWLGASAMARLSPRSAAVIPIGVAAFGIVGLVSVSQSGPATYLASPTGAVVGWVSFRVLLGTRPRLVAAPAQATEATPGSTPRSMPRAMPRNRWEAPVDRRQFMARAAALSAGGATLGAISIGAANSRDVQIRRAAGKLPVIPPGADAAEAIGPDATVDAGVTPFITPNGKFYKIDTTFVSPRVDLNDWRLKIHGRVEHPLELSFDDLLHRHVVERVVTLCCVSNEVGGDLIGNARWMGVPLAELLKEASPHADATQVAMTSVDGWTCGFPTELALDGRDALVVIGMNGEPLPIDHGFPVRIVVPGLYGYVSATKWVSEIELTTLEAFDGYWIDQGWAKNGPVKTQSRIDVPRQGERLRAGKQAIAGIAWAQHRGITKVEVRVNGGEFVEARLGAGVSTDAWRQWIYEWDAAPGDHHIEVRATDGRGATQTSEEAPPAPDGATGYHLISVSVS